MGQKLSVSDARERLSDVLGRVQFGRERIPIHKHGRPVALVIPVEDGEMLARLEDYLARHAKGGKEVPLNATQLNRVMSEA